MSILYIRAYVLKEGDYWLNLTIPSFTTEKELNTIYRDLQASRYYPYFFYPHAILLEDGSIWDVINGFRRRNSNG